MKLNRMFIVTTGDETTKYETTGIGINCCIFGYRRAQGNDENGQKFIAFCAYMVVSIKMRSLGILKQSQLS